MENEKKPSWIGYYMHKDGTPVVAKIEELEDIKKHYKNYFYLDGDNEMRRFLTTYNAGYNTKRLNIKPFYP
jgi:hypothetical protein